VETALWLGDSGVAATVAKAQAAQAATGRFTQPDEVADGVVLLASGRAANLTGTDVVIDGGLLTTL
jgi:NAD(P)-dependent dehydrogenase (short-subunit alcohol dehydrogenase family)